MPAVKKEPCSAKVKDEKTLKVNACGTPIPKGMGCPNKSQHMLPYPTGFCQNKNCEGSARKSYTGKPMKTCDWWKDCPCQCHLSYDQMFAMAEMERIVVDNSGYSPDRGGFVMPTLEERAHMMALSAPRTTAAPVIEESPAPDLVPASIVRTYAPTPSGRAAPGELEAWVKQQCDIWLVEDEGFPCTPKYLSEEIARTEGIKAPSVGAITAIFNRWVAIGFAEIAAKPARFVKYTPDGVKLGLEGCKLRAKQQRKNKQAQAARRIG